MEGRGQTKEMSEKGEKTGDGGERIICFGELERGKDKSGTKARDKHCLILPSPLARLCLPPQYEKCSSLSSVKPRYQTGYRYERSALRGAFVV